MFTLISFSRADHMGFVCMGMIIAMPVFAQSLVQGPCQPGEPLTRVTHGEQETISHGEKNGPI